MGRVFITMRESLNSKGEITESIEKSYLEFFKSNFDVYPLSFNSSLSENLFNDCSLIVLTGGGTVPNEYRLDKINEYQQCYRDELESKLISIAIKKNIPLFCICRGAQFVNGFFGGKTQRINFDHKPAIPHRVNLVNGDSFIVNSYHNDFIDKNNLAKNFVPLAYDDSNRIVECFYCETYRIAGVQWHPERLGNDEKAQLFVESLIMKVMEK